MRVMVIVIFEPRTRRARGAPDQSQTGVSDHEGAAAAAEPLQRQAGTFSHWDDCDRSTQSALVFGQLQDRLLE